MHFYRTLSKMFTYKNAKSKDLTPLLFILIIGCSREQIKVKECTSWKPIEVEKPSGNFFEEEPWLLDLSSWASNVDKRIYTPDDAHLGDFAVGNGSSFAILGLAYPLNTLHNIIGPNYERDERFFGDTSLLLRYGDPSAEANFDEESAWRVRKTPIIITRARDDRVELYTIDFAPKLSEDFSPLQRSIMRISLVRNRSDETLSNIELFTRSNNSVSAEGDTVVETNGARRMIIAGINATVTATNKGITIPIGDLAANEEKIANIAFVLSETSGQEAETFSAISSSSPYELLEKTRDYWIGWSSLPAQILVPDKKVMDLIDTMLISIRIQCADTGGVSPMSQYTRTWLRDTVGPVYFFLRMGLFEDVKKMLDYYYYASVISGDIKNSHAVNYDISSPPPAPDWSSLPKFTGRVAAESPSYLPLMFWRYYLNSGDEGIIGDRYDFLKRAVLAQNFNLDYLLSFSGDETYRTAMSAGFGLPLDYLYEENAFSANSSFLFVSAAEKMAEIARILKKNGDSSLFQGHAEKARESAEQYYWLPQGFFAPFIWMKDHSPFEKPYEDVNTQPLWTGYADPYDQHAIENILKTIEIIGRDDGTIQTPLNKIYKNFMGISASKGVYTGMVPGYFLYNLSQLNHPLAEKSFNSFENYASPSGNFPEYGVYDDRSALSLIYDPAGNIGNYTARFRPWEGGIDLDALVYYLTGLEQDSPAGNVRLFPHLPNCWRWMECINLRIGEDRFDISIHDLGGLYELELSNKGNRMLTFDISLPFPPETALGLRVDNRMKRASDFVGRDPLGNGIIRLKGLALEQGKSITIKLSYRK